MSKLVPLRVLVAVAPSGGEIRFVRYTNEDRELSYFHGLLTAEEDRVWWRAKLAAEKAGDEQWQKAAAILVENGWTVG